MSIKEIKSNNELLNAYTRYINMADEYRTFDDRVEKQKEKSANDKKRLINDLINAIDELFAMPAFNDHATEEEIQEVEDFRAEIAGLS